MTRDWTMRDLEYWNERIQVKVDEAGLDCFPQEFEVCDHEQMLGYMAYSGMPAHYPHWSYGKSYERQKTLYDYGASGLPYEMVINSNPSLAYLMQGNSLCLQILTIAHVYGHNDFFKNNFTFGETRPELVLSRFKSHAERVRQYTEDPSIGIDRVEEMLDAAHALSLQCRRHTALRKLSPEEQLERARDTATPARDPWSRIHPRVDVEEPDLARIPLEPEEDVLSFIRDHNPALAEWQRDLLTIVIEQTRYFVPQIETKIMNEGWASYWHHWIMSHLDLPQELHLEFLVHHSQVVRPHPGQINPYYLGFVLWHDIENRYDEATPAQIAESPDLARTGRETMFEVREVDRDVSFLRRFLTPEVMRRLDLFEQGKDGEHIVVKAVSDEDHWQQVKQTLLRTTGMAGVPVIQIEDADHAGNRTLLLRHRSDGRELQLEYAEHTLRHLRTLWGRDVVLETVLGDQRVHLRHDGESMSQQSLGSSQDSDERASA